MKRVLVVDDAEFIRLLFRQYLTASGYQVSEASNGVQAIEQYTANQPDAVLLDVTMPGMDGLEVLREIMKVDSAARVMMVTATSQQFIMMDALKAGAKDFMVKPFRPERLVAAIEKLVA